MNCKHDKNYKRLKKIAAVFFTLIFLGGFITYQQYRFSFETVEVEIYSKHISWRDTCDEYRCMEIKRFNIITSKEHFTTTEDIYEQIEPNRVYILGTKGFAIYKTKRKVVKIY